MKIAAIADPDTITGLRLAGVKDSYPAETADEAERTLQKLTQDKDIGLIILTEKLADKIRETITEFTSERTFPVVVEIPDKRGIEAGRRDPLMEMIRRAVGIELKF